MKTHAYLIMAHNEPQALQLLLAVLDHANNNIYVHIDADSQTLDETTMATWCQAARLTFVPREKAYWSGYSLVHITLNLLAAALKDHNSYYHLLSGVDLPLVPQGELHRFFEEHAGKEFISTGKIQSWKLASRYKYYYPEKMTTVISRNSYRVLRLLLAGLQAVLLLDRSRRSQLEYHMGGQWFSITHAFAHYVLEQRPIIEKHFKYGFCVDEVFLPTLAMNSPFREKLSPLMNLRYVDWTRGAPYTWQLQDFTELTTRKGVLFARKFSYAQHPELMEKMKTYLIS